MSLQYVGANETIPTHPTSQRMERTSPVMSTSSLLQLHVPISLYHCLQGGVTLQTNLKVRLRAEDLAQWGRPLRESWSLDPQHLYNI